MKKFKQYEDLKKYSPYGGISRHYIFYGSIGGGKSCSLLRTAQYIKDNNPRCKIFDIFCGERHEGKYWCLPNNELTYWDRYSNIGSVIDKGPKQYKVNLLYPHFKSKLP